MPPTAINPSSRNDDPAIRTYLQENEFLRREVAELKAQIAAIQSGIKTVLDAIALPEVDRPN